MKRQLSIGIQGFDKLRTEDYYYIDKSDFIYSLDVFYTIKININKNSIVIHSNKIEINNILEV